MSANEPGGPQPQIVYVTAPKKRHGKVIALVTVIAVLFLAVGAGAAYLVLNKPTVTAGAETTGEVFLESAGDQGQDPYSEEKLADDPDPDIAKPATKEAPASTTKITTTAASGGKVGLYGGTTKTAICSTGKMINFMKANPDKAAAWVAALNADPDLRWDGGTLTVSDIPTYLKTLTPVVLVSDTRVTNHGYANNQPTLFQSVLQKGSAVLIDPYGVPRVRCMCGNPLRAPIPVKTAPKYQGRSWSDFDSNKVEVVQPTSNKNTSFKVRVPATKDGKITTAKPGLKCPDLSGLPAGSVEPPVGCNLDGTRKGDVTPTTKPTTQPTTQPTTDPTSKPTTSPTATPTKAAKPAGPRKNWPLSKTGGKIIIKGGKVNSQGYRDWTVGFSGYEPYRRYKYTCTADGTTFKLWSTTVADGTSGIHGKAGHCFSKGTLTVTDHLGNSASKG